MLSMSQANMAMTILALAFVGVGCLCGDHWSWNDVFFSDQRPDSVRNWSTCRLCDYILTLLQEIQVYNAVTDRPDFSCIRFPDGFLCRGFRNHEEFPNVHERSRNMDSFCSDLYLDLCDRSVCDDDAATERGSRVRTLGMESILLFGFYCFF